MNRGLKYILGVFSAFLLIASAFFSLTAQAAYDNAPVGVDIYVEADNGRKTQASNSCDSNLSSSADLSALRSEGFVVTPKDGFYISAISLVGKVSKEVETVPISDHAVADPCTAALTLPAEVFLPSSSGKGFELFPELDDSSSFSLVVVLRAYSPSDSCHITYNSGILAQGDKGIKTLLVDENDPSNSFLYEGSHSDEGHVVLSPLDSVIYEAATESEKGFVGWKMTYENGSSVAVSPGEIIRPYGDCVLSALWEDVFVVCVQARSEKISYGESYTGNYDISHSTLDEYHQILPGSISFECVKGGKRFDLKERLPAGEYTLRPLDGAITDVRDGSVSIEKCRFFYNGGTVTVEKKPLSITAASASAAYSGSILSSSDYLVEGLLAGDTVASVSVSGAQLGIGTSENVPHQARIMSGSTDVTNNYDIRFVSGSLTVDSPIELTLRPAYREAEYSGETLTAESFEVVRGHLADGDEIGSIKYGGGSALVCEQAATSIDALTVIHGAFDVTYCYKISFEPGSISVRPCDDPIVITARSAEKAYDGTLLTESACDIQGLDKSHFTLLTRADGEALIPGESGVNRVDSHKIFDSSARDVTNCFSNITLVDGTLTVVKCPLVISAANARKAYDGTELFANTLNSTEKGIVNGYTTDGSLVSGHVLSSVSVIGSGVAVGRYKTSIDPESVEIIDSASGKNVTEYYDISLKSGELEIVSAKDSIPVTVTALSSQWIYDGKAHSLNEYSVSGLVDGDVVSKIVFNRSSTITDVGSVSNSIDYVIISSSTGEALPEQKYAVTYVPGTLSIEKYPITIYAPNGEARSEREAEALHGEYGALANAEHRLEVSYELSDNSGETSTESLESQVSSVRIRSGREDVTGNYSITSVNGLVEISDTAKTVVSSAPSKDGRGISPRVLIFIIALFLFLLIAVSTIIYKHRHQNKRRRDEK